MSVTPSDIKSTYPLPVYNYKVTIDGVDMSFTEVSGLAVEFETHTYVESPTSDGVKPRRLYMPAQLKEVNISMKRGIVNRADLTTLYDWIAETQLNQISKRDITVSLCDETGAPVVTWKVINAFPSKMDAPTFDANSNDAAIESLDLMADKVEFAKA